MPKESAESFPENALLAQLDSSFAIQDYLPRQNCVRLIGVSKPSFMNASFNDEAGCQTYIIDIGWEDLWGAGGFRPRPYYLDDLFAWRRRFENMLDDPHPSDRVWLSISYEIASGPSRSYAYPAFTGSDPTYLNIKSIHWERGGPTVNAPAASAVPSLYPQEREGEQVTLEAFHVGQGMCSLFSGKRSGILIDAGAGTPVTRDVYRTCVHRNGKPFVNELRSATHSIASLFTIVTHPDSDHWRLLDWDEALLDQMNVVFLPAGQPALAFSAPQVKPKVKPLSDEVFTLNSECGLSVHRTQPARSDKNGESLVVRAYGSGREALLSGDYVYGRMASDGNAAVAALATSSFDAVVVPHHGDEASAAALPWPKAQDKSVAFFSAGTHAGYGHPTTASLSAHHGMGFVVVDRHWCADILSHPLFV